MHSTKLPESDADGTTPMTLVAAISAAADHTAALAVSSTRFDGDHELGVVFGFVRRLKGRAELRELDAETALLTIERELASHRSSLSEVIQFDWGDDAEAAFLRFWEEVRFPGNTDPLTEAAEWARRFPVAVQRKRPKRFGEFVSIAAWLQLLVGDHGMILLPVELVADLLSVEPRTVGTYRNCAVEDGYLTVLRHHAHAARRATGFRFENQEVLKELLIRSSYRSKFWNRITTSSGHDN